jgi:hypothetical protein
MKPTCAIGVPNVCALRCRKVRWQMPVEPLPLVIRLILEHLRRAETEAVAGCLVGQVEHQQGNPLTDGSSTSTPKTARPRGHERRSPCP